MTAALVHTEKRCAVGVAAWATFSPTPGFSPPRYRYLLGRRWHFPGHGGAARPSVLWVMLNPSTADAFDDDPTIRKCVGFSRRWGFGELEVVNLFAWRATDPSDLRWEPSPVGPDNDAVIVERVSVASSIVVAWGDNGAMKFARDRTARVYELIIAHRAAGVSVLRLGAPTKRGQPAHPLMLPYETGRDVAVGT